MRMKNYTYELSEPEDDDLLSDAEEITSLISILKLILTKSKQQREDCRIMSISQALVAWGDRNRKINIDGDSCINLVLKLPLKSSR